MEETMIEIPESTMEEGWQPPILTHQETVKKQKMQSCADVFFIQYAICILLVTIVFTLRFCDRALSETVVQEFCTRMQAPTESCINSLITFLQNQWS